METSFYLNSFKPEKNLKVQGSLKREKNQFSLTILIKDPQESIKFSYLNPSGLKREFGLWEKTCFEVFLKKSNANEYIEFNFSSDQEWSCFHFDNYKEGMKDYQPVSIKELTFDPKQLIFKASWEFISLDWEIDCGVTAILQKKDLSKTFWALSHPNLTPDFHDFKSFSLKLPPQL